MPTTKVGFSTVNEYLDAMPSDARKALKQVRAAVKAQVPGVKEKIGYQMPTFELNGKNLLGYAGWKSHISIYPIPAGTKAFNDEVAKYAAGRGTVKFALDKPLPLKLIKQIVKYRLADHLKNIKEKTNKKY